MVNEMGSYDLAFRAVIVMSVIGSLFVAATYYGFINP